MVVSCRQRYSFEQLATILVCSFVWVAGVSSGVHTWELSSVWVGSNNFFVVCTDGNTAVSADVSYSVNGFGTSFTRSNQWIALRRDNFLVGS